MTREIEARTTAVLLLAIAMTLLQIWALLAPRSVWQVTQGWKYKGLEPSRATLILLRVQALPMAGVFWYSYSVFYELHARLREL